jgi:hypothetical protein
MSLIHKEDLEPRARVELATCRLRIGCSTTELPRPVFFTIASAESCRQFSSKMSVLIWSAAALLPLFKLPTIPN